MKRIITAATALALLVSAAAPAFADDHGYNNDRQYRQHNDARYQQNVRNDGDRYRNDDRNRFARQEWRDGDRYQGHRVAYHDGAWGYFQPNAFGSNFFIRIGF